MARVTSLFAMTMTMIAFAAIGCTDSSGNSAGPGTAGRGVGGAGGIGAAGTGGAAAGTGGGAAGTGGGTAGTGGGAAGTGGGAAGTGGGGSAGACGEPASCEGYDNRPDAGVAAVISCLSPSAAPRNAALTLAIYGHHLATGAGQPAIVTVGAGVALNGVPMTACHLDVQVPANQLATAGPAAVVVSPGSWIQASGPVPLTVQ